MIVNGVTVESSEHLETLIAEMDEESRIGVRLLYAEENQ